MVGKFLSSPGVVLCTLLLSAVALLVSLSMRGTSPVSSSIRTVTVMIDGQRAVDLFPLTMTLAVCVDPNNFVLDTPDHMNGLRRVVGLPPTAVSGELIRPHFEEIEAHLSPERVTELCTGTPPIDHHP